MYTYLYIFYEIFLISRNIKYCFRDNKSNKFKYTIYIK